MYANSKLYVAAWLDCPLLSQDLVWSRHQLEELAERRFRAAQVGCTAIVSTDMPTYTSHRACLGVACCGNAALAT
jgi:hypothetical protein